MTAQQPRGTRGSVSGRGSRNGRRARRIGTVVTAGAVGLGLLGAVPAWADSDTAGSDPGAPRSAGPDPVATSRLTVADQFSASANTQGFGAQTAVSADGRIAVVRQAAPQQGGDTPAVVVLTRGGSGWARTAALATGGVVHSVALSADGSTLALARLQFRTGQVQVEMYTAGASGWSLTASLPLPDSGRDPREVALSADGATLLVSAPTDYWAPGAAVAFHRDAQGWTQETLVANTADAPRRIGGSVALSGDGSTAVLSAGDAGADEVFTRIGEGWVRTGTVPRTAPGYLVDDDALSVSYDGSTVAVGNGAEYRPTTAVYSRTDTGDYTRTADFSAKWVTDNALGSSVALSADGRNLLVGAPGRRQKDGLGAGAVYRYVRTADGWTWGGLLNVGNTTPWDHLGTSVAVSADGSTVLAGAPGRTVSGGGSTGAVVVYAPR